MQSNFFHIMKHISYVLHKNWELDDHISQKILKYIIILKKFQIEENKEQYKLCSSRISIL